MVKKYMTFVLFSLVLSSAGLARSPSDEAAARKPVESFYTAFNQNFSGAASFATEDWAHINPFGGWARGRENVLAEVRDVHSKFLKDVSETVEQMEVRFASQDVAIVTVISKSSPYTTPDGVKHENERHIRTFVVVKRGPQWLVMQDQSTTVRAG